jgi:muramoyltetrapeptide carboxypeptidase
MTTPRFLKQGDSIAIVAPARKLDKENVVAAVALLESWGLQVMLGTNLFTDDHSYFSASDEKRITDFQKMIDNESIQAIFCARGGYGSTRIVDRLNFEALQKKPKWIVGFSDITAIHLQLSNIGVQSIHGNMPVLFNKPEAAQDCESLRQLLFGNPFMISGAIDKSNRKGTANGELIGGNLSLLVDSLGTKSEVNTVGKILVIEEVSEYFYKIDRMMVQLKRAEKLSGIAGLIVGHFTDIKESTLPFAESVKEIILSHTREYNYPIAFNFPVGHEHPNLAWIHGAAATLLVDNKGSRLGYNSEDAKA